MSRNSGALQCKGCDDFSFKLQTIDYFDRSEVDEEIKEEIFPTRLYKKREKKYLFSPPKEIKHLYSEIIIAYDNKLLLLATVGVRALIETIVISNYKKEEYTNSIQSKINAMSRHFNDDVIKTLHEFRIMGNKAIHTQVVPDQLVIHHAIRIVESILEFFYGVKDNIARYNLRQKKIVSENEKKS